MQKLSLLAFFGLLFISCGQEDDYAFKDIPSVVTSTFQTNYPYAKDLEWKKREENFEAEFEVSFTEHKVLISPKGKLLQHKNEITFEELPKALKISILKKYELKDLDDIEMVSTKTKNYYQLEIDQNFTDLHKVYDELGKEKNTPTYWD